MSNGEWLILADLLRHRERHDSDRPAFADDREAVTYAELGARARARAGALSEAGVAAGDRVAIMMSAGVTLVECFWAVVLLGAAPCLLNPSLSKALLARRLAMLAPRLVIDDRLADSLLRGRPGRGRQAVREAEGDPEAVAYLQLTSGSTGEPRVSLIRHRNLLAHLRSYRSAQILGPEDVFVSWVPPWHDLGLVRFVIAPVFHGARCQIVRPSVATIPRWLMAISELGGTYSAAPDFALRLAVRMVEPASVDLSRLRSMKCGGEPVRASTLASFGERFGCHEALHPGYGLGEAVLGVSEHLPGERFVVDGRGNVSCGFVNPFLDVRSGGSLEHPQEIRVRGESVFAGYLKAPEETARALRDGWLHTGDSGYLDREGRLYVLGRRVGMIKRAGVFIAPRELEEAAQRVSGVALAAAVAVCVAEGEEAVVVAIERARHDIRPERELGAEVSREVLADVGFAPSRVEVLDRGSIPLTENGKIRYGELRALLSRTP